MSRTVSRIDVGRLCYEYVQASVYPRSVLEGDLSRSEAGGHEYYRDHEGE